jgi:AraC-like DNA-binding protein/DNA gyrase inhibitor GyrI
MDVQPHLLSLSAYIDQNLDKDLPLFSLAKRVGLSPFHFHRKFGAYFGESLHQHIKRLRLERAAFELTYGSKPVRDIARDSGYKTVSAFSHAFSGFAGVSPTRYRSRGPARGDATQKTAETSPESTAPSIRPAWIGELAPQEFAFVRAVGRGHGHGAQASALEAMKTIIDVVEKQTAAAVGVERHNGQNDYHAAPFALDGESTADANAAGEPIEFIVATTDFYGVVNAGDFRIDIGIDAARLPADREGALGMQTLPGGRYARFDFDCKPEELIGRCYRAAMYGLRGLSESSRTSAHFVRFTRRPREDGGPRSYRFFMPLV